MKEAEIVGTCSIHRGNACRILAEKPEERRPLGDIVGNGRIIIKMDFKKYDLRG
jgi:hypothetical protein